MFDDHELKEGIVDHERIIQKHSEQIEKAKEKLIENNRYKSILYLNSKDLVDIVFEMLEKMLSCDLSSFEDKKVEDFVFKDERIQEPMIKKVCANFPT